ncbi:ATP-binding protein [Actinomadura sp. 6N118]|uniref:ATP-binding protein n=1 Tax=Actinomadura sp. 6N118 TaxID=3375151 RepID=UPI00378830CB
MLKRLAGEPMLLSLCAQQDATEVVERMIDGVVLEQCPEWIEVADAALDWLDTLDLTERTHWLALPLGTDRHALALRAVADSALSALTDALGLAPPPVTAGDLAAYKAKAAQLESQLTMEPAMRPATPAEVLWIYTHALRRGLAEPLLADAADSSDGGSRLVREVLRGPSLAHFGQVRLTEGGQPPRDSSTGSKPQPWWRKPGGLSPLRRRWLQVESDVGTSYQAFLALGEMPAMFTFPGSEYLADLDGFDFPVDYACRLKIISSAEAEAKSRRKARELTAQAEEYDGETAGIPQSLIDAATDLDDERARLQSSSTEVEVQSTTIMCVWGTTPEDADQRAEVVRAALSAAEYQLVRPTGSQRALFSSMLPGSASSPVLSEFRQYQLASDFAMAMPWACSEVGDPTGMLLGLSLDDGSARPVLLDLANAPRQDASASMGVVGELGAGKSVLLKSIIIGLLDRGGRVIAVDRTPMGEWVHFAEQAAPGRHQVIRADEQAQLTLDPLRVFPAATAARYAKSYLTLQLGVPPMSPGGLALAQAVDAVAMSSRPHMRGVISELQALAKTEHATRRGEHAAELADLLRVVAADPLAQMVFGDLPPLRLDGDFCVFHTAGLTLPKKEVFTSEYHMQRQPLETLIGRSVLYVIAAAAREVAFADPGQFVGLAFDECYWLTNSTEGQDLVLEIVRDGRKHDAGALLGSHDPEDFGNDTIRGLLPNRFLLRHRDSQLAAKGLEFLNLDPGDPALIEMVTTNLSPSKDQQRKGEALFLDTRRRTGKIKILIPPVERIATSILTTPSLGTRLDITPAAAAAGEVTKPRAGHRP